jgi:uncharacterized protein YaiL (DUF2058 family)
MIIHIGNNISLLERDILLILDRKTVELSKVNKAFVNNLIDNNELMNNMNPDIKSYIIVQEKGNLKLYVSNISSTSLLNRHRDIDRRDTNE